MTGAMGSEQTRESAPGWRGPAVSVWMFITPQEAADALPLLTRKLGRRQGFWDFLIEAFRRHGVVAR